MLQTIYWLLICFFAGACLGSFFQLLVDRWLVGRDVVFTRSACDYCQTPLAYYDLCPIIGYWCQHGRCRHCQNTIGPNSLQAELIGASSCCWLWWCGFNLCWLDLWLLFWLFLCALLDQHAHFVYQGLLGTMIAGTLIIAYPYRPEQWFSTLILALFLLALAHWQGGLGSADIVWLAALIFVHGSRWTLLIILLSNLLVSGHYLLRRRTHRQQEIPYLPYLFASYLLMPLLTAF